MRTAVTLRGINILRLNWRHLFIALLALLMPAKADTESASEAFVATQTLINGGLNGAPRYTYLALTALAPVETMGTITGLGSSSITDSEATWSDQQYNGTNGSYYLEFASGLMADIAETMADGKRLLLKENPSGLVTVGQTYKIRKYFTVADIFGATNEVGLTGGINSFNVDKILLFSASSQAYTTIFYCTHPRFLGWRYEDYTPAGGTILFPDQGFIIERSAPTDVVIHIDGVLSDRPLLVPVLPGFNLLGTLKATMSMKLSELGLYRGNAADGIAAGINSEQADNLFVMDSSGAVKTYFFCNHPAFSGWRSESYELSNNESIAPGSSFMLYRKSPRTAFYWSMANE